MCPVKIRKVNGYQVRTDGVKAKSTTKAKAERQANLLRAVEKSDWRPTGATARDIRESRKVKSTRRR